MRHRCAVESASSGTDKSSAPTISPSATIARSHGRRAGAPGRVRRVQDSEPLGDGARQPVLGPMHFESHDRIDVAPVDLDEADLGRFVANAVRPLRPHLARHPVEHVVAVVVADPERTQRHALEDHADPFGNTRGREVVRVHLGADSADSDCVEQPSCQSGGRIGGDVLTTGPGVDRVADLGASSVEGESKREVADGCPRGRVVDGQLEPAVGRWNTTQVDHRAHERSGRVSRIRDLPVLHQGGVGIVASRPQRVDVVGAQRPDRPPPRLQGIEPRHRHRSPVWPLTPRRDGKRAVPRARVH